MRDILGKKLHKGDAVIMLTCGTGGSLYKVDCLVTGFEGEMVIIEEIGKEGTITIHPSNLLRNDA